MTNPHQTNSVEEVIDEYFYRGKFEGNSDPACFADADVQEKFLRSKLTTLVSEAKREVIDFVKCKEHSDQLCGGCHLCSQNESLIKAFLARTISSDKK